MGFPHPYFVRITEDAEDTEDAEGVFAQTGKFVLQRSRRGNPAPTRDAAQTQKFVGQRADSTQRVLPCRVSCLYPTYVRTSRRVRREDWARRPRPDDVSECEVTFCQYFTHSFFSNFFSNGSRGNIVLQHDILIEKTKINT